MLPRLQADEAFAGAEQVAIGTGSVEARASKAITARWSRAIEDGRRRSPAVKATPRVLGALGIGVRRVPRKAKA